MNALDLFDKIQPERERLDDATATRVWNRIVASSVNPAEVDAIDVVGPSAARSAGPSDRSDLADSRRGRHTRLLVVAACVALVAGAIVAIAAIERRAIDDETSGRAAAPVTTVGNEVAAPEWYEMIRPHLPPGFEHVTLAMSDDQEVAFEAFDPSSSKSLLFSVSRSAVSEIPDGSVALDEARAEPWTDPNVDLNVTLPDGRRVVVACRFARPTPTGGCPQVNGNPTDPEVLRQLAVALATEIDVERLPPVAPTLDHVSTDAIRAAMDRVADVPAAATVGEEPRFSVVEEPRFSASFVALGDADSSDLIMVRTVTGFYPPLPATGQRTTTSIGDLRLTWQVANDGVLWLVSDNPSAGDDVADAILDLAIHSPGSSGTR